ncbi:MAG TPA: 2-C-methyl-D-erythritol 4-phosphate cytidylyltransferase [Planctomycetia bacterium]|nr:2-C-methyl-D-erythritol 4-phosphate cytidylyltransferase [Planctomycetia bacterium]
MPNYAVVLLLAGKSSRFQHKEKKPYADLDGRAVWLRSLEVFSVREDVKQILIAISPEDEELFDRRYRANVAFLDVAKVVMGGDERVDSVQAALAHVKSEIDYVAVHDAARPCLTAALVEKVFESVTRTGASMLAAPVVDTVKRTDVMGAITETIPRERLWLAQTPQVFERELLLQAYAQRGKQQGITDDSQLVEALGRKVHVVESDPSNFKITVASDLPMAAALIKSRESAKPRQLHPFGEEAMW